MAVSLPCALGTATCDYVTPELQYEQAREQLELHMKYGHPAAAAAGTPGENKKPEKFPRPVLELDTTEENYAEFAATWKQYKEEFSLTDKALIRQLIACCSTELRTSISRLTGGNQYELNEVELLRHMKQLAVRHQNPAVHVQQFLSLSQQSEEGVRSFLTRLQGVACRCSFTVKCEDCNKDVSYQDNVVRFKLIQGLTDSDIKEHILSEQDKSLEETVKAIEAKECGKLARQTVGVSSPVAKVQTVAETKDKCRFCGRTSHRLDQGSREKSCPAWGKECRSCGNMNHFSNVCLSKKKKKKEKTSSEVDKVDQDSGDSAQISFHPATDFFEISKEQDDNTTKVDYGGLAGFLHCVNKISKECNNLGKKKVPHMLYEQLKWIQKSPRAHPTCRLSVDVSSDGYRANNLKPPSAYKRCTAELVVMADTGCQVCVMGKEQLQAVGLSRTDLLMPALNLRAANTTGIDIIGCVYISISGVDRSGQNWVTNQLCYIAEQITQLILSREACEQLGMVSPSFPTVGCAQDRNQCQVGAISEQDMSDDQLNRSEEDLTPCSPREDGSCDCPRREPTPPRPEFDDKMTAEELKGLLIRHYRASAFNKCTRQKLPMMKGEPLSIPVRDGVKPHCVNKPVPIPVHYKERVLRDLKRDVALGVIEPVPPNTPQEWCARMVVVPKHNGEPRRTVDLQALNRASVRQTNPLRSPFMLASEIPAGKLKTVFDVWNSFHSCPVRAEDTPKLTFICEFGRFRYKTAPQGYLASGDGYTLRFEEIAADIKDRVTIVDDTAMWHKDLRSGFEDACHFIEVCHNNGLILNPDKFQFAQETVEFAGLEVTMTGVRPARKFLEAIKVFPRPTTLSEARSFFGMVNQVNYAFATSEIMAPFRHLLRPDTWDKTLQWTDEVQDRFERAKQEIIEAVEEGVRHFEMDRPTCLGCDWSRTGLGFFLMQKWCKCDTKDAPRCCANGWKLVLAGGRFTKPAESRYSPVEGEMLAVVDALHRARHFVLGCTDLTIIVDHKPLLGLLNDKSLAEIDNPRLLMLKEKTLWYNFKVKHVPGRLHNGPDYMSRQGQSPAMSTKEVRLSVITGLATGGTLRAETTQNEEEDRMDNGILESVVGSISDLNIRAVTFNRVKLAVRNDEEMQQLVEAITETSNDESFPQKLADYNKIKDSMSVVDGVPMYGRRVIIPAELRAEVLGCLHSAHQGVCRMNERAMASVYWPRITADIEKTRQSCTSCDRHTPTQAQLPPVSELASPEFPFQMTVADYCAVKGKTWLVVADRFSGWVSLFYYEKEATARDLINKMKQIFTTFGVAEHFSSDEGPQFRAREFQQFLAQYGVEHRVSSAYFPHSNLRAEAAVKSAKRLIRDNTSSSGIPDWDKINRALLNHRNTPDPEWKLSPAQLIFGRPVRDFLPIKMNMYNPAEVWITDRETRELALRHRMHMGQERWSQHTKDLAGLQVGQHVSVQNQAGAGKIAKQWDRTGVVVEDLGHRKYRVRVDGSGRLTDRNRQFLREFKPATFSRPGATARRDIPEHTEPGARNSEPGVPGVPGASSSQPVTPPVTVTPHSIPTIDDSENTEVPGDPGIEAQPASQDPVSAPRRSSRGRMPQKRYNTEEWEL